MISCFIHENIKKIDYVINIFKTLKYNSILYINHVSSRNY